MTYARQSKHILYMYLRELCVVSVGRLCNHQTIRCYVPVIQRPQKPYKKFGRNHVLLLCLLLISDNLEERVELNNRTR